MADDEGWAIGTVDVSGRRGLFPLAYVAIIEPQLPPADAPPPLRPRPALKQSKSIASSINATTDTLNSRQRHSSDLPSLSSESNRPPLLQQSGHDRSQTTPAPPPRNIRPPQLILSNDFAPTSSHSNNFERQSTPTYVAHHSESSPIPRKTPPILTALPPKPHKLHDNFVSGESAGVDAHFSTEEHAPPRAPVILATPTAKSSTWPIPAQELNHFTSVFHATDTDRDGFCSGAEVRDVFSKSKVSKEILADVWRYSDVGKDGKLSVREFVFGMWMIYRLVQGEENAIRPASGDMLEWLTDAPKSTNSFSNGNAHALPSASTASNATTRLPPPPPDIVKSKWPKKSSNSTQNPPTSRESPQPSSASRQPSSASRQPPPPPTSRQPPPPPTSRQPPPPQVDPKQQERDLQMAAFNYAQNNPEQAMAAASLAYKHRETVGKIAAISMSEKSSK